MNHHVVKITDATEPGDITDSGIDFHRTNSILSRHFKICGSLKFVGGCLNLQSFQFCQQNGGKICDVFISTATFAEF